MTRITKRCQCCKSSETFSPYTITSCHDCPDNGVWDLEAEEYVYGEEADTAIKAGGERDQVSNEGECKMGDAEDCGCIRFICVQCGDETHLPTVEKY